MNGKGQWLYSEVLSPLSARRTEGQEKEAGSGSEITVFPLPQGEEGQPGQERKKSVGHGPPADHRRAVRCSLAPLGHSPTVQAAGTEGRVRPDWSVRLEGPVK